MDFESYGVVSKFQQMASQRPHAIAAYHRSLSLSYSELNERSQFLAAKLAARGVAKGSVVAVCVRPGFDILISILAIFRCRAIYLPLDPTHPKTHIINILEEVNPRLILSQKTHAAIPEPWHSVCLDLDEIAGDSTPLPRHVDSETQEGSMEDPAYLMYTSGTTGKPKGVLLSHANLKLYLGQAQKVFKFQETDIFCNVARYTFSISLFDLLLPLGCGGAVRLIDREDVLDFSKLTQYLSLSTVFHAGPSLLATLFRYLRAMQRDLLEPDQQVVIKELRHVSTGGDIVLPAIMQSMQRHFPRAELFVIYGSTEISCMGTYFPITKECVATGPWVGKPFESVQVFLLNEDGSDIRTGDVGEICFGGPGIGLGYLNQPELTAEKFINRQGQRVYCTGDFGKFVPGGNLEILGRRDFQVKVRGIRLELSGIENCILDLKIASHCVVTLRKPSAAAQSAGSQIGESPDKDDSGILVAFLAGCSDPNPASIRAQLAKHVPEEMLPSRFIFMDALPVTFNGKLDRRKLAEFPLDSVPHEVKTSTPVSDLEKTLATILSAHLGLRHIDPDQNIFELGAHSLLAVSILMDIKQKLGVLVSPHVFFQNPTLRCLLEQTQVGSRRVESRDVHAQSGCSVIALNTLASGPTMFFLSGVHIYRSLAKGMDENWSIYAVMSEKELSTELQPYQAPGFTVEDLAQDYKKAILQHQAKGPFVLLGYSFAGIVAYEVAQQLTQEGHEVQHLVLIDAILPEWIHRSQFRLRQLGRILRRNPLETSSYAVSKLWELIGNGFRRVSQLRVQSSSEPTLLPIEDQRVRDLEKERGHMNRLAAEDYLPRIKAYQGRVTLFVAEHRLSKKPLLSRSCGWRSYIPHLKVIGFPADHLQLLQDQKVIHEMARHIQNPT